MKLQLLRSATLRIQYNEKTFMIDPYLGDKHSLPSYTGKSPNPMVSLGCSPSTAIQGLKMVLISHLHSDHFDSAAKKLLPKDIPVLCQPQDESSIMGSGFTNVCPITDTILWEGITITRTSGRHGSGSVLQEMGEASGFLFQGEGEPTVYWIGDTIFCPEVAEVIAAAKPDIIITHSNGAVWGSNTFIVMNEKDTVAVCQAAPYSIVIATHMEALDHGTVSRRQLREYAENSSISPKQLLIPLDGESYTF